MSPLFLGNPSGSLIVTNNSDQLLALLSIQKWNYWKGKQSGQDIIVYITETFLCGEGKKTQKN